MSMSLFDLTPLIPDGDLIADFNKTQVDLFYSSFKTDFIDNPFKVGNKILKYIAIPPKDTKFKDYPESFYHIVTKDYVQCLRLREYDHLRANRIHWIKPILTSKDTLVKFFRYPDDKGVCKDHYYLYCKDFMVVTKDIGNSKQIVTAFCVEEKNKEFYYEKFVKYRDGEKLC